MLVSLSRREVLLAGSAASFVLAVPALASPEEMNEAIRRFTSGAETKAGRVRLDLPPLVENGNAAPLAILVESPMTEADHVRRIAVFNERNPQPNVITAHLGPRSGRASLSTRIRLANSQRITAVAEMSDGSFWSGTADVIVTLAACIEGA
ncbi:SoxY-related AACIE arm protein [Enterovirga aerilata]|uniref:SoxY-related AACIE arm protein n=1 Tax=Enterovirga aerilata TaxID=2730920 RepID=A0A849IHF3_9HYPH|nr:SoxY-related AACIE arm protein [Enterovirga sp. DB1703]NNM73353.1 SoxY-related AACIE arm protein [Enterovirga sp. DB1703]